MQKRKSGVFSISLPISDDDLTSSCNLKIVLNLRACDNLISEMRIWDRGFLNNHRGETSLFKS